MKKIIFVLFLLCVIVTESNAQIVGGGEYTQTTTQTGTSPSQTNGLIKGGAIVLSTAGGAGLLFTILGVATDTEILWGLGIAYFGVAVGVGVPLIAAGIAKKRRSLAVQTTPILNYDFRINDQLTLSANLNVMSKSDFSSTTSFKRDRYAGTGLVLHF